MGLILGALRSTNACFDGFQVRTAELRTSDTKALYTVLRKLSAEGKLDGYYSADTLFMKVSDGGEQALIEAQGQGHYSVRVDTELTNLSDPVAERQIFYSAFRRLLASKGFESGRPGGEGRKVSPAFGEPAVTNFVLNRVVDNVFQQGYRCFLEIRKSQEALLWIDPAVSVYNTFKGRHLNKAEITNANLILSVRRWSVLDPRTRLSKAQQFVSHIGAGGPLNVEYADHTIASFNKDFAPVEQIA